ncbi:MAG: glycosyltransferase family 9 protein [Verrucomicrobiae bacterium]|nr:glycosyltransferase family 9 protein [Verrucomicrobiae bacterium]
MDPEINPASMRSALIVKPSSLGDVIHTLPAVDCLHRSFSHLSIDWLVNTEWAPLLEGNPGLRQVIPLPRRQWRGWRDLFKAKRWASETLAPLRPDLVLDFQGLLRSALLAKSAHGETVVGFRNSREGARWFYDRAIEVPGWRHTHAVDRYLRLVGAIGVEVPEAESISFPLPEGDPIALTHSGPFLLLHPFSRGRGKSMNFREVSSLCGRLRETQVVLVGAGVTWPSDLPFPENAENLLGATTLPQLIWLMRRAKFILSVDSGPMHLAAAVTARLLSLHTWTDPLMVGPWRQDAWVWRDGFLGKVAGIAPGQFPEQRHRRGEFDPGILPGPVVELIAEFLAEQMNEA